MSARVCVGLVIILAAALRTSVVSAELVEPTIPEKAAIVAHVQRARRLVDEKHPENNLEYGWAYILRNRLEIQMGMRDSKGSPKRPDSEMIATPDDLKKISGGWFGHDSRGDYNRAVQAVQDSRRESRHEYVAAIDATIRAYLIPMPAEGARVNGPPDESRTVRAQSPMFDDWTKASKGEDEPGYVSHRDGIVYIRPQAFFNHADIPPGVPAPSDGDVHGDPDPGYLASILYHESLHIQDFLTPPDQLDLHNEPAQEVSHRMKQLLQEDIFLAPAHDFLADLMSLVEENDLVQVWDEIWKVQHKDPYIDYDRKHFFPLAMPLAREQQIHDQVAHDAEAMARTDETDGDSIERLRAEAQTDFFKRMSASDLSGLVAAWKRARRVDDERSETNRQIFLAQMGQKVEHCGFVLPRAEDGGFDGRFSIDGNGWQFDYKTARRMSAEQFELGVMLAASCVAVSRDHSFEPPCNNGLAISRARGSDAGFKEDIAFDVPGNPGQMHCIQFLRDRLKPTMIADDYVGLLRRAWEDYQQWSRDDRQRNLPPPSDGDGRGGGDSPDRPERPTPGERHAPAPGNCWFDSSGAHCN